MVRSGDLAAVHVTEQQLEVVGLHILRHHDHTVIISCAVQCVQMIVIVIIILVTFR